jgi:HPt (histidine-containing phosphotransfer) domain-containing protein
MSAPRSRAATLLLPRYLEHRARDVAALRRALDLGDFPSVSRIGHNLRGNGKSYGFPEVGAMGEALEAAASTKSAASILEQIESLEAWLTTNRDSAAVAEASKSRPTSTTRVRAVADQTVPADREDEDDD